MGGTGASKFCGCRNLQLIVSRRNPAIAAGNDKANDQWGFTVVRREDPSGNRRSSVYTYLASVGCREKRGRGGGLRFHAETMPIFPEGRNAYARTAACGTLVKLYEYAATGVKGHILRKDGMLSRMDILLPDAALPIRFHECRPGYRGHAGSFETTLTGLSVRLGDAAPTHLQIPVRADHARAAGESLSGGDGAGDWVRAGHELGSARRRSEKGESDKRESRE